MLSSPERFVTFIAYDSSNTSIGFIEVSIHEILDEGCEVKNIGYIEGWYIDPNYRRKGIGSELVKSVEKWVLDVSLKQISGNENVGETVKI